MRTILVAAALLAGQADDAQTKLLKTFRDEFVALEPAAFTMGSEAGEKAERPAHKVTIKKGFRIAKVEVTQDLWTGVMGKNPSKWKGARNSVEMLSYGDAAEFCEKVTALLRAAKLIEAGETVRLPAEAEWEYAARAGTATAYSFGDDPKDLGDHGWFTGNAAGNDPPVGAKKPNPWKLYDIHGYLWEWCADAWHDTYEGAPADGSAWTEGGDPKRGVLRSGSWKDKPERLTSFHRRAADRDLRDDAVGLRCVLATP